MTMRITGLSSGLDTESIIKELTSVQTNKITKVKSDQKKHEMKTDKWKELNKKVVTFYNKALSNMRFDSSFVKKSTDISNTDAVSVVTSSSAMNSAQTLSINSLASSAYLTGAKLDKGGDVPSSSTTLNSLSSYDSTATVRTTKTDSEGNEISYTDDDYKNTVRIKFGPEPEDGADDTREYVDISISSDETIAEAVAKFKEATSGDYGLNASYDSTQGRVYLTSSESGEDESFSIDFDHSDMRIVNALGLNYDDNDDSTYVEGTDSSITLNGVNYTSNDNSYEINGLTITAKQIASDITLTTTDDASGVYDMIKDFLGEYNDIIGEMSTLYNADDADDYEILTAEQKEEMTEEEIEDWNKKIEEGLLSGDSILGNVLRQMKNIMLSSYSLTDKDGNAVTASFSTFGIATLSYFESDENERGQWHIDGDEDDEYTSGKDDKLNAMITSDPSLVSDFFKNIAKDLYSKLGDLMKSTEFSSSFTLYEDKQMKTQYEKYTTQLEDEQDKLEAMEDKYYDQFAAMEKAMTELNSKQSALSGMIGS